MGEAAQVIPTSGNLTSVIASFYTSATDAVSLPTPIAAVYYQAQGANGNFDICPFGAQVSSSVGQLSGGLTSTTVVTAGSQAVTAGDRFILAIETNSLTGIESVSISTQLSP